MAVSKYTPIHHTVSQVLTDCY